MRVSSCRVRRQEGAWGANSATSGALQRARAEPSCDREWNKRQRANAERTNAWQPQIASAWARPASLTLYAVAHPAPPAVVPLVWTRACPEAFLQHLEALASRIKELWDQGRIRAGEPGSWAEAAAAAPDAGGPLGTRPALAQPYAPADRPNHWHNAAAGEKNALQEAVVGAVCAAPPQLQASVVEWVLAEVGG